MLDSKETKEKNTEPRIFEQKVKVSMYTVLFSESPLTCGLACKPNEYLLGCGIDPRIGSTHLSPGDLKKKIGTGKCYKNSNAAKHEIESSVFLKT